MNDLLNCFWQMFKENDKRTGIISTLIGDPYSILLINSVDSKCIVIIKIYKPNIQYLSIHVRKTIVANRIGFFIFK